MKTKKTSFIVIAVFVIFILIFSRLFIAAESGHDCSGEECRVCRVIATAQRSLKELSLLLFASFVAAVLCAAAVLSRRVSAGDAFVFTPVLLKVKLTD